MDQALVIAQVVELTGIRAECLRIWEHRYGWPRPERGDNGYRRYDPALIPVLLVVTRELARGRLIGEILADERLGILEGRAVVPVRAGPVPVLDFSAIPLPVSPDGRRIRAAVEAAVRCRDTGRVAQAQSEAMRLRPDEREAAVDAVLRVAAAQETAHS